MQIEDVETHRGELEVLLTRHTAHAVRLSVVPDVEQWSRDHDLPGQGNPIARALVHRASGDWVVLIRRSIGAEQITSVLDGLELFGGFPRIRQSLTTPTTFLKHLVLHELAHLANDWDQSCERECDEWALERVLQDER